MIEWQGRIDQVSQLSRAVRHSWANLGECSQYAFIPSSCFARSHSDSQRPFASRVTKVVFFVTLRIALITPERALMMSQHFCMLPCIIGSQEMEVGFRYLNVSWCLQVGYWASKQCVCLLRPPFWLSDDTNDVVGWNTKALCLHGASAQTTSSKSHCSFDLSRHL